MQIPSDQTWTQALPGFSRHWMTQVNPSHLCTWIAYWGMMITLPLSHADKIFNPSWQQIKAKYLQPFSPHCLDLKKKKKVNIPVSDLKYFNTICYLQLHEKKWKIHSRRRLLYELHYLYEWISNQWKASTQCQKPVSAQPNRSDCCRKRRCFVLPVNDAPSHSVQHICPKRTLLTCFLYRSLQYPIQAPHTSLLSWDQLDWSPRTSSVTSIFMNQAIKLSY